MSTEPEDAVRPPTYTSDGTRSARHPSPSPSPSDSDQSLVSAPSRPASPLPSHIESTSQISHLRSTEITHPPSPGPTPLSQGYIVGPYHARVISSPPPIRPLRQSLDVPSTSSTTKITIQRAYSRSQPIASVNATNYACILRKTPLHRRFLAFGSATSSITGSFTIDPFLYIPVDLLPPLRKSEKEADRKNLRLEVENGGIDVNINLVGENPSVCRSPVPRTTIGLGIAGGSRNSTFPILARIHTPTVRRPPFHLVAKATNGLVCIHLPRSFHGMVSVSIAVGNLNNHISLSLGMQEQATILSETPQARSYFVGRMGDWSHVGDKAELIVYSGKVSVQFDDEVVRRKGWSTLFA